jgi:hypothetical protein
MGLLDTCAKYNFAILLGLVASTATGTMQDANLSFDALKRRIIKTVPFRQHVDAAMPIFCKDKRNMAACQSFLQDAIFCLEVSKHERKLHESVPQKCNHLDQTLPDLSELGSILATPGSRLHRRQEAFLQQTAGVETWARSTFQRVPKKERAESFIQKKATAPEDELAKEMTHDLEMNFNKIAPFGKEDTAKELQDHAAKTQDTLVDAVENAEVAEIKRAVFRALTRLRAATIKEFDTIARLETQAIDAYNDAHHYRAENPLTHLHEDEAPVETDKLKSFH